MAVSTMTFRVYRSTGVTVAGGPFGEQIGPDLVATLPSAGVVGNVFLIAVDTAPVAGTTYVVTGQSDTIATDVAHGGQMILLTIGP